MVSSEEDQDIKTGDTFQWDVNTDNQLFYAMANLKPVGINRHFHMVSIWEKLSNSITKEITVQDIWKHLETLYDMQMLEDTEPIPFPNDEVAFSLPDDEFGALIKQKCKEIILVEDSDDGQSPSLKISTPRSNSRGIASKDSTPKSNRKDSTGLLATKSRKESGSSHASTDTPSIKSEIDYDPRRDSRDSNASGPRDSSSGRKSLSQKDKQIKNKIGVVGGTGWESPMPEEDGGGRRGRRRGHTATPPATAPPAKRRRY